MIDLSSSLFFKSKFDINAKQDDQDLLWKLIMDIREWMVNKWRRRGETIPWDVKLWSKWKMGCAFSSQNDVVRFESIHYSTGPEQQFWASKIIEAPQPLQEGFAPREWVTEIGYQQSGPCKASVSIVVYYSDRPGFIGPCEDSPDASIPKLIQILLEDAEIFCTVGDIPVPPRAISLQPGQFHDFWSIVSDKNRDVPIIYISPRRVSQDSNIAENLVNPEKLAGMLGPNAVVYYATNLDFSREMTYECRNQELTCYSGRLRIYAVHPHFSDPADRFRHRYINANEIIRLGTDSVCEMLRRALAQDVHFYETMFRMEDCKKLIERDRLNDRMQVYKKHVVEELLDTTIAKEQTLEAELTKIEEERFSWEIERDELQAYNDRLKDDLFKAKTMQDVFRDEANISRQRKEALEKIRTISKYPVTPEEVALYFEIHFADRIAFTKRGMESLQECTTNLGILWNALYQMSTLLYELFCDDECTDVAHEFNQRSTFSMARDAGSSMTTEDKELMRYYQDTYEGRIIDIGPHIKTSEDKEGSPRFLRVYFCFDTISHKIVIGSCGRHLPSAATRKL